MEATTKDAENDVESRLKTNDAGHRGGAATDVVLELVDDNPLQPRAYFNAADLADLVSSLELHGQIQAISVRSTGGGRYALIDGSCRLQAARKLGWRTLRATVLDVSEAGAAWMALEANDKRVGLHPFEAARLYEKMLSQGAASSQKEIADRLHKSPALVSQCLTSYRRTHPDIVEDQMKNWRRRNGKKLPGLHIVRELARLDHEDQIELYESIKSGGEMSAEAVSQIVGEILERRTGNSAETTQEIAGTDRRADENESETNGTSAPGGQDAHEPTNNGRDEFHEPEMNRPGAAASDSTAEDNGDPAQTGGASHLPDGAEGVLRTIDVGDSQNDVKIRILAGRLTIEIPQHYMDKVRQSAASFLEDLLRESGASHEVAQWTIADDHRAAKVVDGYVQYQGEESGGVTISEYVAGILAR